MLGNKCGVTQNGIALLKKLKILYCCNNGSIKNVNHLSKTLQKLYCRSNCGVCGELRLSKIRELNIIGNGKIRNIGNLRTSKYLSKNYKDIVIWDYECDNIMWDMLDDIMLR